jgi:type I restriction enzyme M protein
LKTKQLTRADLDDFVDAYKSGRRHERIEADNFKRWTYEEIAARTRFNLGIWADVKDESLEDAASLPAPEVIAEEIVANLTTARESFAAVVAELGGSVELESEADV